MQILRLVRLEPKHINYLFIYLLETGNDTPTSSDEEAAITVKKQKSKLNELALQRGLKEPIISSNQTEEGYQSTVSIDWLEFKGLKTHSQKQDADLDAAKVAFSKLFQLFSGKYRFSFVAQFW